MKEKVEKINVGISQKINLGNYETRDYSISLEISGFNSDSKKEIQSAIDFGRDLCLTNTNDYYAKVKNSLMVAKSLDSGVDRKYLELEEKINKAQNESQLRSLTKKVEEIKDEEIKKVIQKKFNIKLISFKE